MKGSGMWLSRRQMRWLVVLLALLPLVPAILMVRLMLDNARRDRDEAVEIETRVYRNQLIHLVNRTSQNSSAGGGGEALFAQLRRIFGDEVTVVLRAPSGGGFWKWGDAPTEAAIVAEIPEGRYAGWTVVLDRVVELPEYIGEQMRHAWWRAGGWAFGVAMVAAVVWFAVHRGLRVDELRSDLLTTVSHEMKTPLASMRVLLETLTDDETGIVADGERRREYLDLVLRENRRLTRLADDFLTFARLERGDHRLRREICDPGEAAAGVVEELSPAIQAAGARIELDVPEHLRVWGDADALSAVLRNLVENALKYAATGDRPPRIVVSGAETGRGRLLLTVTDDGPGIPPEFRRAVFRRYFRIDSRLAGGGSGVGLGLAICRHLVRRMRGRISLEAPAGGGCRFVIRLPRVAGAAAEETSIAPVMFSPRSLP
jgi:signal transduction histidine kinase